MKKVLQLAIVVAGILAAPTSAGVKVAGETVEKAEICPGASTSKCVINNVGTTSTYIGSALKYITLDAGGEPEVEQYLGHLYTRSMSVGEPYCEGKSTNVFKDFARTEGIPYLGTKPYSNRFHITSKASKIIGASGNVDAKAAAIAAGVPAAQLDQVAAAISAGYNRASSKKVEIWGWFNVYQINPDILTRFNSVDATPAFKACREWLKANNRKVIWTVTGYKLDDAKVTSDFKSAFAGALEASLKGKVDGAQIAAVKANYNNEVEHAAEVNIKPAFGLLTIATAPY